VVEYQLSRLELCRRDYKLLEWERDHTVVVGGEEKIVEEARD